MRTRTEHVEISISCDVKDCESDSESRYSEEEGPYNAGWRTVRFAVYDKYTDRYASDRVIESDRVMHICPACMFRLFKVL